MILKFKENQPPQLYMLFFAEMWERFSFYGMRALLTLYMIRQMLYDDEKGYGIYAAYGALVYATPFLGGIIADNLLGYRKSVLFGGILMAIGHFLMAVEHEIFFYSALAFLIMGNGFFKPNISSIVGSLYEKDDPRRDAGFTIFYMGINLGAALAPLVCGYIGEVYGWHYGFGLAGIGMLFGLIVFGGGQKKLGNSGLPPNPKLLKKNVFLGLNWEKITYLISFLIIPLFALLVSNYEVMTYVLLPFVVIVLVSLLITAIKSDKNSRERIFVILILLFFSALFWAFFEQAGSSISLFTDRNVDRNFLGFEIPTSQFQFVNPFFIICLGPLFALMWVKLGKIGKEPSTPLKFALGIIQLGLGFAAFVWGASAADGNGMVPLAFLILGYLLHTTGELCLSPVGLSMVTKLAPAKIMAMVMGAWFLSSALAHHLGGFVAQLTSVKHGLNGNEVLSSIETLSVYSNVFGNIALTAVGAGILLLTLVPLLRKWMHGIH